MTSITTPLQTEPERKRLLALDILRGFTVAGMVLVNNPGGTPFIPLEHAEWNGLTPTDLVFPFFMFIMGVSTYLSLRKYDFACSAPVVWKILRRTVLILLVAWALGWFGRFCGTFRELGGEDISFWERLGRASWTFDRMRILGVLPRLALSYGAAALVAVLVQRRRIPWIIGGLLVVYSVILLVGHGYDISEQNVIGVVDRALWGPAHMYRQGDLAFDPEGLLSTIPSVAHVLIGFWCGAIFMSKEPIVDRLLQLMRLGAVLMLVGWLLSYGLPINKKVWSPTFVLITCGMGMSLLALLVWVIDVKGHRRWCRFFEVYGINPLFLYVMAGFFAIVLGNLMLPWEGGQTTLCGISHALFAPSVGEQFAALIYALMFVCVIWLCGYPLYRKRIYIKL